MVGATQARSDERVLVAHRQAEYMYMYRTWKPDVPTR